MTEETKPKKPIWKKWWFWIIAVIVIIIIASAGGGEKGKPQPEISPTPKEELEEQPEKEVSEEQEATWQEVKSWQGTGIKNTEPFVITGKKWRIVWSNEDTTGFGGSGLQIYVYKPGLDLPVSIAANAVGNASDTSYIYESGEFYLNINGANGNWTISVEDFR